MSADPDETIRITGFTTGTTPDDAPQVNVPLPWTCRDYAYLSMITPYSLIAAMSVAFLWGTSESGDGAPLWFVAPLASGPGIAAVVLLAAYAVLMTALLAWHDAGVFRDTARQISLTREGVWDTTLTGAPIAWGEIEELRFRHSSDDDALLMIRLKAPRDDLASRPFQLMQRLGLQSRTLYINARLRGEEAHTMRETAKALAEAKGAAWNKRFFWAYFDSFGLRLSRPRAV